MSLQKTQLSALDLVHLHKDLPRLPCLVTLDDVLAVFAATVVLGVLWYLGLFGEKPDPHLHKLYERPQENVGLVGGSKGTRDISEKLDQVGADIVVFWGSQSGTAERFANRLAKETRRRFGVKALAADVSDFDCSSIGHLPQSKLAIFILSTFGEGDPSDNVQDLWHWLENARGAPFTNLRYIAFGLGNSNYKHYNAVVDFITEKLNSLGARPVLPIAKADDAQGGTEEHYLTFKQSVYNFFKNQMRYQERDPVYEPTITVVEDLSLEPIHLHQGEPWAPHKDRKLAKTISPVHSLLVIATRELFTDAKDRNCVHIEVDLTEYPGLKYKTGDHLGIWPASPKPEVERLLRCLGRVKTRSNPISLRSLDTENELKVPTPTSLEALFCNYIEICAGVSRETIAQLAEFAPDQPAKEELIKFSTDKTAYDELSNEHYLNLGRLLEHISPSEAAWQSLPLSLIVEVLPAMQPRYYSISSSAVVQARQIAITAVVYDKRIQGDAAIPGLCTNHLLELQRSFWDHSNSETRLYAHVRKSTFKTPVSTSQPIIMVAAGTGIALSVPSSKNAPAYRKWDGELVGPFSSLVVAMRRKTFCIATSSRNGPSDPNCTLVLSPHFLEWQKAERSMYKTGYRSMQTRSAT